MPLPTPPAPPSPLPLLARVQALAGAAARFPWKSAAVTLVQRFREDRLGLTASSLTFTTTMALVPFITVALAVFTAFPMFAKFQDVLQRWLIESLVPDNIARQVLGYLTQFAGKASKLGAAGVVILLVTALALIFTIDRTLNSIWRVPKPRAFAQRVLVYWAALTLGPLVLAVSLTVTSYAITASRGVVGVMPGGVQLLLDLLQFVLMAGTMAAMYRYVPNTWVQWRHAWAGGLFVAAGFEVAKKLLALYLSKVPTYALVYGAFATLPILLIWLYVAWVIVLLGAVMAACLPSLVAWVPQRARGPGLDFQLALEALQLLQAARSSGAHGLTLAQLTLTLRADPVQLDRVLANLRALDWVGQLQEDADGEAPRQVLLAEPSRTPLAPLLERLLLQRQDPAENLWKNSRLALMTLDQAL